MGFPVKGEQVVFTKRVKLDVPDDDNLAGVFIEKGFAHNLSDIPAVTGRKKSHGLGMAFRGVLQALASHVFAEKLERPAAVSRESAENGFFFSLHNSLRTGIHSCFHG